MASRSPRRRELLGGCDLTFEIADGYEVEEIYPEELAPECVAEYLSRLKADGYPWPLAEGDILIHGHTHVIRNVKFGNKNTYLNPGSITLPKENFPRSYMIYNDREFTVYDISGDVFERFVF